MSQEHRQGPSVSQLDSKFIQFLKNPSPSLDLRFSLFLQTKSSRHNLSLGSWDVHTSEVLLFHHDTGCMAALDAEHYLQEIGSQEGKSD
ncbi:hypothetical protein CK203_043145 [Vitis vinifera]|uniref:Uncharacterized protein n=1 Tax=Vitis vinifera TaxID=29760 RepID=A0A438H2L8_VITVI|nr:hypothetical protein CK203_043145 [Vitis vinifera]